MIARWRERLGSLLVWFDGSFLGRWWGRLVEIEFIDRAVALAAKAFVAFFPLIVVVAAYAPAGLSTDIIRNLEHRLGLSGAALNAVQGTFASPAQIKSATGVVGILLAVFYATTFTTALQRVILRAWRRPPPEGVKQLRGLAWIAGVVVYGSLLGGLRRVLEGGFATGLFALLGLIASFVLWWWTQYVMLYGHVRWRVLAWPAAAISLASTVYGAAAVVWVPRSIEQNQAQFGFFGVALALVSWLVGLSFVLIIGAALGPVLSEDRGFLGRLARGGSDDVLRPGAPAALPAPPRPHLVRAFGVEQSASPSERQAGVRGPD